MTALLALVLAGLKALALDPERLALAWARVMPAVFLVPAFGLRGIPTQTRGVFALMLALVIAPSVAPANAGVGGGNGSWPIALVGEVLAGLPVALAACIPLWAATMVGGLVDQARGQNEPSTMPTTEGKATPFGHLYSLLAATLFLLSGGASRVANALILKLRVCKLRAYFRSRTCARTWRPYLGCANRHRNGRSADCARRKSFECASPGCPVSQRCNCCSFGGSDGPFGAPLCAHEQHAEQLERDAIAKR
jgi:hypothetical protein